MISYILLLLLANVRQSQSLKCENEKVGSCYCTSNSRDLSVYCPDPNTPKIILALQPNQYLTIKCMGGVTVDEVLTYLAGLDIGNSSFVKLTGCPVPDKNRTFARMFREIGVTGVRALSVSNTKRGKEEMGLQGSHFTDLSSLYHLDLANNGIKYVDRNFFRDIQNLKVLDLSSNNGLAFEEGSLENLTKLEELKLSSCGIKTIPENFFETMPNLKILNVHDNEIAELPPKVFKNQKSVTNLVLTRNWLRGFPAGIFDSMAALSQVNLGYNRFETFPEKLFFHNHNLRTISIIVNGACPSLHPQCKDAITKLKLPANMFFNSTVEEIKILWTPIAEIPANWLAGCSQLKKIIIQQSMLQTLPESLFKDTKEIEYIDFYGNMLEVLPDNLFKGLHKLETLRIIANQLKYIDRQLLLDLTSLKTLHFQDNAIAGIDRDALSQNKMLEEVDLSNNNLSEDNQCFKANILEKLKTLNLANNQISSVYQDFLYMSKLQALNLSHNEIGRKLMPEDINFVQNQGLVVDLSFNNIERIILKNGFEISGHNFLLNITGNPLICDCTITELKMKLSGILKNMYADMFQLDKTSDLICSSKSFGKNSGESLQNVKFEDLLCPFPSASMPYNCSKHCSCFLDRFHKETVMNCSSQNLTTLPENLVLIKGESEAIRLHMENNLLANISKDTRRTHFQQITHLYLSNNRISHFDRKMVPQNLQTLFLDQNRIAKFEEEDLQSLDTLVKRTGLQLQLSRNPFLCNCDNRAFYHFVQNRESAIKDVDQISLTCEEEDLKLLDTKLNTFCDSSLSPALIAIVIIIVIVLMVVCALLLFYSCHRETIKIWIYSKSWARIFFSEDLIDKDKPYDAFLSYSHMDAEFVEGALLQGLENPENPDHKYKCLIHTRDWNIGQMIPDQIVQSVHSSRRTLIVLSKAYIESMWTKLEFRAAHTQAMQDKTQRVILIVIGQLPADENLDTDLKKYISLNTYLDSQDPWFWQKLRYAMPHRGTFWKKKKNRKATDKIELIRSQASIEINKGSRTPSPKTLDVRSISPDRAVAVKINDSGLIKESGALVRNNPHLHAKTINQITPSDKHDSYLLI
eukprot:GFUD01033261.1.p1 GENE.GFUD01033261.1~~GFUD01033261.1.p1  ORF type:complete len:1088 (+),score=206.14 GFUD01033261.1:331-3594(+)